LINDNPLGLSATVPPATERLLLPIQDILMFVMLPSILPGNASNGGLFGQGLPHRRLVLKQPLMRCCHGRA
jgi:hypothetical protein